MSNGIGGRTVAEAKARMSHVEFLDWLAYLKKRGSLNQGMRTDLAVARLSLMVNRALGGKAEFADFLPNYDDEADDGAASLEDVAKIMGARVK